MCNKEKLKKKILLKVLAEISEFDIEKELFISAGSFAEALDLFLKRFLAKLISFNQIYKRLKLSANITHIKTKAQAKREIDIFLKKIYDNVFAISINQYVEIAKYYKTPRSQEKTKILKQTMDRYLEKLSKEFNSVNLTASRFLKIYHAYGLKEEKILNKLEFLSSIDVPEFLGILKKGDIDLLM